MVTPRDQCAGCDHTCQQLDVLLLACVHNERARSGDDDRTAALHVLAAVASWWLGGTLARFADRDEGMAAAGWCLLHVFEEHGLLDRLSRGL